MSGIDIFACAIDLSFLVFGLWHELTWRLRLKDWIKSAGLIIDIVDAGDCNFPVIEYLRVGKVERFQSKYSGGVIGTEVVIAYHEESGDAEVVSRNNRLIFSVIPIVIGAALLYIVIR